VKEGEDEAEGEESEGNNRIEIRRRDRSREGSPLDVFDDGQLQESMGSTPPGLADEDVGSSEDTERRKKRFSMPAVALQTAPVFARARRDSEVNNIERRRSALMYGGDRDKGKKEKEGSAVGLLMEVLRGKVRYPGRS